MARFKVWISHLFKDILFKDVRSALVGAAVGSVVAFVGTLLAHEPEKEMVLGVSEEGYGKPKSLFTLPELKNEGLVLQFHPAELQDVYVCEHSVLRGSSWKNIVLTYFNEYRMCFYLIEAGDDTYSIYPNLRSGELSVSAKNDEQMYFCKCGGK